MPDDANALRARKAALRATLLARLKAQPAAERAAQSARIAAQLLALPEFHRAQVVVAYSALAYEVDTAAVMDAALAAGKRVALPRIEPSAKSLAAYAIRDRRTDLEPGPFGVLQPHVSGGQISLSTVELVLVPGVGFDRAGWRLGHGQGYYDRWLALLPAAVPRIGLAFACQVVDEIPVGPADQPVSRLISA